VHVGGSACFDRLSTVGLTGTLTGAGSISVGTLANTPAVMNISNNITTSTAGNFFMGGGTSAGGASGANAVGAVYQTAGNFIVGWSGQGTQAFEIGAANNGYGYYKVSGGYALASEIAPGGGGTDVAPGLNTSAVGIMDVTGGTVNSSGWITIGHGSGQVGELNVSGASARVVTGGQIDPTTYFGGGNSGTTGVAANGEFGMNWGGVNALSVMTISNGGLVDTQNTRVRMNEGPYANSTNTNVQTIINLNSGGILRTQRIRSIQTAGYTPIVNFNGGILKASVDNPAVAFISDNANNNSNLPVYVYSGGGTIDNSGFSNIPIATPFLAPVGSGVSTIPVATGGSGYIGAPAVTLSGGSGAGATAIATINPATGIVTGITVTSAGSGYTPGDVLTATLIGGGATTPATVGTITLAPNVSGGMTFIGSGNTILNGTSTYTGATTVSGGGTLTLSDVLAGVGPATAGSINLSSSITLNSGNLVQNSPVAISAPVIVTSGTIKGNGIINSVTVANAAANAITSNNTGGGLLTIGSLTLSGAGKLNLTTSPATASTPILPVTTLAANGAASSVTIAPSNTSGGWAAGTYQLVQYSGSIGGTGFSAFNPTLSITGLGARQSATLTNPAGLIDLVIAGDSAVWTAALNGNWTTATLAAPKNWVLSSNSLAQTDYVAGDAVVFDDTATGSTTVTVTDTNVQPALVTFNNTAKTYTITGNPIAGTGGMILNGAGIVNLNAPNSFSGGVIVNAGSLNLGATSTATTSPIGTGRLTLGLNTTIDNTSGSALTLLTNNLGTWNGDFNFTGTNSLNLGAGAVTVNANGTQANAGTTTINVVANTLTVGGVVTSATAGLTKTGAGALVLGGGGTFGGANQSSVFGGKLVLNGGTFNFTRNAAPSLAAGFRATDNTSIVVNGGTVNTTSEIWLGSDSGTYGSLTVNGGAVNVGSWLALGRASGGGGAAAGIGLVNINGGTVNVATNQVTIGSFGLAGSGLILVNPPWPLADELNMLGPALCDRMRQNVGARWSLDWLSPPD
jgi:autotransporter-associated beta strand protein